MPNVEKAHCNVCLGETNHRVLHKEATKWSEQVDFGQYSISGSDTYEMLKCMGCDAVVLRHTRWWSEEPEPTVIYYPATIQRQEPRWIDQLLGGGPFGIPRKKEEYRRNLLREIYIALNNASPAIAVMGIRGLLEHVMIDKVSDNGSFTNNLKEFERQGHVGSRQFKTLKEVLEIGHAAIHRSYAPDEQAVDFALDFTENLLQSIYIHELKAKGIQVPKRKTKRRATPPVSVP